MSALVESVAAARNEKLDECVKKMEEVNGVLKERLAKEDATAVHEAMKGGLTGIGANHERLIACLCSRSKRALARTAKAYREQYGKELRADLKSETSSSYGKMMWYALASREQYGVDILDAGMDGIGMHEETVIDLFVTRSYHELRAIKDLWEKQHDKSLIDRLNSELGHEYRHLKMLLLGLLKDSVPPESQEPDPAVVQEKVEKLHKECSKGMMSDFKEDDVVDILVLTANQKERILIKDEYEKKYDKSLSAALSKKCGKKFFMALDGLLKGPPEYIAARLHFAMKGFGTYSGILVRLLGGLDHESKPSMQEVQEAYQNKYQKALSADLRSEISGNFLRASLRWIDALRHYGSTDVSEVGQVTQSRLNGLLREHARLCAFIGVTDAANIYSACKGIGTNDTALIKIVAARNKKHLSTKVAPAYYELYDKELSKVLASETSGWYKLLLSYIILAPEQADVKLLDSAMDGLGADGMAIIEFLVGRPQLRVRAAKESWEGRHDKSLVDRLSSELHGANRTLALALLKGERDETAPGDPEKAKAQAIELYEAGEAVMGTDEDKFIDILAYSSPAHNKLIADAYEKEYGHSLVKAICSEMSGNLKSGLCALLMDSADFFAMRLKVAFKGLGTADRAVCRILGSHDKAEAKAIADAYLKKYQKRLHESLASEISGNYRRLAQAWIGLPDGLDAPTEPIVVEPIVEQKENDPPPPYEPPTAEVIANVEAVVIDPPIPEEEEDDEATVEDEEEEDDDDDEDSDDDWMHPPPPGPRRDRKVRRWSRKLQQMRRRGRMNKAKHYKKMLTSVGAPIPAMPRRRLRGHR